MDYNDKIDILMKFWDRKGNPRAKDTLYFGWKFQNNQEYLNALSKYYGVGDIKRHMLDEIKEILVGDDLCDNNIELVGWNIEDYPMTVPYDGYGGKSLMKFKYDYNPNWVLPKEWIDQTVIEAVEESESYDNPFDYIRGEMSRQISDAYDEESCVFGKIYEADKYIRQKYGFVSNIESGMRDYSKLDELIDYYTDIALSKLP